MKQISSDFNLHLFDDDLQINSADLSRLREKQAQAKQLREAEEKWEQEYCRRNRSRVALPKKYSPEELAEQERLKRLLGG